MWFEVLVQQYYYENEKSRYWRIAFIRITLKKKLQKPKQDK